MQEAVDLGIPGGIVISAGFKEIGARGKQLEDEIMQTIRGKHAHHRAELPGRDESADRD